MAEQEISRTRVRGRLLPSTGGGGARASSSGSSARASTTTTATPTSSGKAAGGGGTAARSAPSSAGSGARGPLVLGAGSQVRAFSGRSDGTPFMGYGGPLLVVGSLRDETQDACQFDFSAERLFPASTSPAPLPRSPLAAPATGRAPAPAPAPFFVGGPALAPLGAALIGLTGMVHSGRIDISQLPASAINASYLAQQCPLSVEGSDGLSDWATFGIVVGAILGFTALALLLTFCCARPGLRRWRG